MTSTNGYTRQFSRRLRFEPLEQRRLLAVTLDLSPAIAPAPRLDTGGLPINVNVSNQPTTYQSEISLEVNPTNPLNLAGLSHRLEGGFSPTMDVFWSINGGQTWQTTNINNTTDLNISDVFGDADIRFDPSIAFDANGNLYIAYGHQVLATETVTLVVAKSINGGASFTQFAPVDSDASPVPPALDKWQLATGLDPLTGNQAVYVAYLATWEIPNGFRIAGSNDGGATFTIVQLADGQHTRQFADPAVGPMGELYVSWHDLTTGTINVKSDLDGLFASNYTLGAETVVRQLGVSMNFVRVPAQPQRGIWNGPVLDVDRSGGEHNGRLYLTWVDALNQTDFDATKNSDVFLAWSDNNGATWTSPGSIGNVEDSTGTDFLPWVDIDQITGSVNVLYYTTDGDQATDNDDVHVRLATSIDGGASFAYANMSRETSNEDGGHNGDYREYIGLAVYGGAAHALWASRVPGGGVDLEALYASASFHSAVGDNVLTITGDDNDIVTDDLIILARSALNTDFLEVTVNGVLQFAGLAATVNVIDIDSRAGNDTIRIDANIDADFIVRGDVGTDGVTLFGRGASALGNFEFFGDAGNDTFTINYQNGDPLPRPGFNFNFAGGDGQDDVAVIESDGTNRVGYFVNTLADAADASSTDGRADSNLTTLDDQTTLRAAVQEANVAMAKTYIFIPSGTYPLSISGSESSANAARNDLDVLGSLDIIGTGAGLAIINAGSLGAGGQKRIFEVHSAASLDLSRVTLTGGNTGSVGGAVLVMNGTLSVDQVSMVGNTSDSGGAIRAGDGSTLIIRNSVFTGNISDNNGGAVAAFNAASVTIGSSVFANNIESNVILPSGITLVNEGNNLIDNTNGAGSFFSETNYGDHIGDVDYVVTTVADTFDGSTDQVSMSLRDAIHLANTAPGAEEIWLPAWNFVLRLERSGQQYDTDVSYGDLDIGESLTIRGVSELLTSVVWRAGTALDKVFELLGDYNSSGMVGSDDYVIWLAQYGQTGENLAADGDDDGDVDGDDEAIREAHFARTLTLLGVA